MRRSIRKIMARMTVAEKASLCSGADFWHTKAIERLDIPSIEMADGPLGLRKQTGAADHFGFFESAPATCFPAPAALACSWDRALLRRVGEALGDECRAARVCLLLAPGCNIKRSPLSGRNFEYFSEDPFLSSEMGTAYIDGLQSREVGACLKHFAANNQETLRMVVDAAVDERTLREIYLASFEGAVKKAQPWAVMCAYNKLNGVYCSENKWLLQDILKEEWGFQGLVVSDWGAVNDRVAGLAAGLDLEMPSSNGVRDGKIEAAFLYRQLKRSALDRAVKRVLKTVFHAHDRLSPDASYDAAAHHALAREAARESFVLLKNDGRILPLRKEGTLAVIGAFAKRPRYQGAGSSRVNPSELDNALEKIESKAKGTGLAVRFAAGYRTDEPVGAFCPHEMASVCDDPDAALIRKAAETAARADRAVVFAGLPESYESEGMDRKHIRLPEGQNALIKAVAKAQENTVVVLSNGGPVEMPWIGRVKAVLEGYLGGQASGGAAADILFGDANPCGKLAESFPEQLSDNPSYLYFPGERERAQYREGVFVGYRWYEAVGKKPLFAFGHGLSYTEFMYSGLALDNRMIGDWETLRVSFRVKNIGKREGKEIAQLYVGDVHSSVRRPVKELKGFEKVHLEPGEEREVAFTLDARAFAFYDADKKGWNVETGDFDILVGASSDRILLKDTVRIWSSGDRRPGRFTPDSLLKDVFAESYRIRALERLIREFLKRFPEYKSIDDIPSQFKEMPLRAALLYYPGGYSEKVLRLLLKVLNR